MLYFGRTYTSTVSGAALKGVRCENCGGLFLYRLECQAEGQGSSPYYLDNAGAERRAQMAAVKKLKQLLAGAAPVPCPDCGWYQPEMVRLLRGNGWLAWAGLLALAAAGIAVTIQVGAFFLYTATVGAALFALWWIVRGTFDPNAVAHERVGETGRESPWTVRVAGIEALEQELDEESKAAIQEALAELLERSKNALPALRCDEAGQNLREQERKARRSQRLAVWALLTLLLLFVASLFSAYLEEEEVFGRALGKSPNTQAVRDYLRRYPEGRHVGECAAFLDDESFYFAEKAAARLLETTQLEAYLSNPANTRHREEALKMRRELVVAAREALLKGAAAGEGDRGAFLSRLAGLLKATPESATPALPVAFRSEIQGEPATGEERAVEEDALLEFRFLSALGKPNAETIDTPLKPSLPGPAFARAGLIDFERVALAQVEGFLHRTCGRRCFTLRPTETALEGAGLLISFHIRPSGQLMGWWESSQSSPLTRVDPKSRQSRPGRLLDVCRVYKVEWTLSLRAPDAAEPLVLKLETRPREDLRLARKRTDPSWVVYSALINSAAAALGPRLDARLGSKSGQAGSSRK